MQNAAAGWLMARLTQDAFIVLLVRVAAIPAAVLLGLGAGIDWNRAAQCIGADGGSTNVGDNCWRTLMTCTSRLPDQGLPARLSLRNLRVVAPRGASALRYLMWSMNARSLGKT